MALLAQVGSANNSVLMFSNITPLPQLSPRLRLAQQETSNTELALPLNGFLPETISTEHSLFTMRVRDSLYSRYIHEISDCMKKIQYEICYEAIYYYHKCELTSKKQHFWLITS